MNLPNISTLSLDAPYPPDSPSPTLDLPSLPDPKAQCSICKGKQEYALNHPEVFLDPLAATPEAQLRSLYLMLRDNSCSIKLRIFAVRRTLCEATYVLWKVSQLAGKMRHNIRTIKKYSLDDKDLKVMRPAYPIHSCEDVNSTVDILSTEDAESLELMNAMDGCDQRHISIHQEWLNLRLDNWSASPLSPHMAVIEGLRRVDFRVDRNSFAHCFYGDFTFFGAIFAHLVPQYEKALQLLAEVVAEFEKVMTEARVKAEMGVADEEEEEYISRAVPDPRYVRNVQPGEDKKDDEDEWTKEVVGDPHDGEDLGYGVYEVDQEYDEDWHYGEDIEYEEDVPYVEDIRRHSI